MPASASFRPVPTFELRDGRIRLPLLPAQAEMIGQACRVCSSRTDFLLSSPKLSGSPVVTFDHVRFRGYLREIIGTDAYGLFHPNARFDLEVHEGVPAPPVLVGEAHPLLKLAERPAPRATVGPIAARGKPANSPTPARPIGACRPEDPARLTPGSPRLRRCVTAFVTAYRSSKARKRPDLRECLSGPTPI